MQDFPTKSPGEEIPTQADNFRRPRIIYLKICGSCPLNQKNYPPGG